MFRTDPACRRGPTPGVVTFLEIPTSQVLNEIGAKANAK